MERSFPRNIQDVDERAWQERAQRTLDEKATEKIGSQIVSIVDLMANSSVPVLGRNNTLRD